MQANPEYFYGASPQPDDPQPARRKGGRKPKYTDEGRKQRNRDAQAAFRERRTEYIKELEDKVKLYSNKLRSMEATKSNTATECLMLRYKNSLLERILLHKGIDINAELNTALWKPPTYSSPDPLSPMVDQHRSMKRKSKYDAAAVTSIIQPTPTYESLASSRLSPDSLSAPETEISTPPSAIELPQPKRSKKQHSSTVNGLDYPGKYPFLLRVLKELWRPRFIPWLGRREEPSKFFSSGDMSLESIPKPDAASKKPTPSMTDFLDIDYDLYEMLNPGLDEFNLGMEFPILPDVLGL